MEYYILKLYQEEKRKCPDVEQGFDRYDHKTKIVVIICLAMMFITCIGIIVTSLLCPNLQWYFSCIFLCLLSTFILFYADSKYQKKHMEKYVNSHKTKLAILDRVLSSEFGIKTKEKLEGLISIYQEYVDKKKEEEKKRRSIILTILSAFSGVLVISFENMGLIGIDFINWMSIAIVLLIFIVGASVWIYSYRYFDTLKGKYEMMIKDLKELLLIIY